MNKAFDIASVMITLRKGVEKGYWTVEQLDEPSVGWRQNAKSFALHHPKYKQPTYRNLLRDEPTPTERVQVTDPRDFPVVAAPADPVQRGSTPLPMATHGPVVGAFSDAGLQGHEGCVGDAEDYGDEAHLGTTWEGGASGVGDVSDDW
jgi:hypothetical protein